MLLLDTSFLVALEDEVLTRRPGRATERLRAHRRDPVAISVVTLGEFAEGFSDPIAFNDFVSRFRVLTLSRGIAWRAASLQQSLPRRLGENDAWIAATALVYGATLVGRDSSFGRVPGLDYVSF